MFMVEVRSLIVNDYITAIHYTFKNTSVSHCCGICGSGQWSVVSGHNTIDLNLSLVLRVLVEMVTTVVTCSKAYYINGRVLFLVDHDNQYSHNY